MVIVDRIEEGIAIVFDEDKPFNLRVEEIVGNVRDGAVLDFIEGKWVVNEDKTEVRKVKMRKRLDGIFGKREK